jgi:hypothetical protein
MAMPESLLRDIRKAGLVLVRDGECIAAAPQDALTPALQSSIAENRAELLDFLALTADPRPDIAEDSMSWGEIFQRAFLLYGCHQDGILGVLRGFRCCGARLKAGDGYCEMWPSKPPGGIWETWDAWKADCERWLRPLAWALRPLALKVARMS